MTKSSRHRAREYALQGVYQWLAAGGSARDIATQIGEDSNFGQADPELFRALLSGTIEAAAELDERIARHLDRPVGELTLVEHAVLLIAAHELRDRVEVPYRVAVNEAIELAKTFGGTDGHRYVNGVLDRLARELRPDEAGRRAPPPA